MLNAGPWIALRHAHHSADQRLQHHTGSQLIARGKFGQKGPEDRVRVQSGKGKNLVERAAPSQGVMTISPAPDGTLIATD
jgi:hypothetical protein